MGQVSGAQADPSSRLVVHRLRVDDLADPLGIDNRSPRLSWQLRSPGRHQRQHAYQIQAASTPELLADGDLDLWDSGAVHSDQCTRIRYDGKPLGSRQQVHWRVRVWDSDAQPSAWSEPGQWELGLLEQEDWDARWVTHPDWEITFRPEPVRILLGRTTARFVRMEVTRLGLPLEEGPNSDTVHRVLLGRVAVVRTGESPVDVTLGADVTVSEGNAIGHEPPLGYRSDGHRRPEITGAPLWVQIELGERCTFDEVWLYPHTDAVTKDGLTPGFPEDFVIGIGEASKGPFTVLHRATGAEAPPQPRQPSTMPVFVRQFTVERPIQHARLHITGLGLYEAHINGEMVGTAVLQPPQTDYSSRVVYSTYDVSSQLRSGENVLAALLGSGAYNLPFTPERYQMFSGPSRLPTLLAQLEITHTDGTMQRIVSDFSWRAEHGPITFSSWYGGEDVDGRRVTQGWDAPGADHGGWADAVEVAPPKADTLLSAQSAPAVRVVDRLDTVAFTEPTPGRYVFDLGTNVAGWPMLRTSGPTGTVVSMLPGERLAQDGTVDQTTMFLRRQIGKVGPVVDRYTLAGDGNVETWHPRFCYHGFRYVQVTGLPAAPSTSTISALVLRAGNDRAGSFACSNELLNSIHRIIDRSIQGNMFGVLTDCPNREKLAWLEQVHLAFGAVSRNYDVAAYYRSLVQNMAEAQDPDGWIPTTAPEYHILPPRFRDDPNWGAAFIMAPWLMYETYGDADTMQLHFAGMQRYMSYLTSRADGHLLDYGLGDWGAVDKSTPTALTGTYAYHRLAATMARIADVLDAPDEGKRYLAMAGAIGRAFNDRFLDAERGSYGSGSQAGDALALDMGIVPAAAGTAVLDHLISNVRTAGNHLTTGEIPLPALFRVLAANDRNDVVYDIATQTTHPSYGHQVVQGATSLTEFWDSPTGFGSQNHFMLGAIDEWFTRDLAGIQQAPGSVAYKTLVIRPAVVGDLTSVSGSYDTPQGPVATRWRREDARFSLDVEIPVNAEATVHMPPLDEVGESWTVRTDSDAEPLGIQDGRVVYAVGSGAWSFVVEPPASRS